MSEAAGTDAQESKPPAVKSIATNGEQDFGTFELGHYTFNFKIDYYDKELCGCSEDPADPDKTTRVLTLMFPGDW